MSLFSLFIHAIHLLVRTKTLCNDCFTVIAMNTYLWCFLFFVLRFYILFVQCILFFLRLVRPNETAIRLKLSGEHWQKLICSSHQSCGFQVVFSVVVVYKAHSHSLTKWLSNSGSVVDWNVWCRWECGVLPMEMEMNKWMNEWMKETGRENKWAQRVLSHHVAWIYDVIKTHDFQWHWNE